MRSSDWSSDVCSSDLSGRPARRSPRCRRRASGVLRLPTGGRTLRTGAPHRRRPGGPLRHRLRRALREVLHVAVELVLLEHDPLAVADRDEVALRAQVIDLPERSEERRVGKSVSVRVDLGGRRIIKKKKERITKTEEHIEKKTKE